MLHGGYDQAYDGCQREDEDREIVIDDTIRGSAEVSSQRRSTCGDGSGKQSVGHGAWKIGHEPRKARIEGVLLVVQALFEDSGKTQSEDDASCPKNRNGKLEVDTSAATIIGDKGESTTLCFDAETKDEENASQA